jgi:hypothetical protein
VPRKQVFKLKWSSLARRRWPSAWQIDGDGPYAVLAHCRVLTVELFDALEQAAARRAILDDHQCGGRCCGDHEIVDLRQPTPSTETDDQEFRQVRRYWMRV